MALSKEVIAMRLLAQLRQFIPKNFAWLIIIITWKMKFIMVFLVHEGTNRSMICDLAIFQNNINANLLRKI